MIPGCCASEHIHLTSQKLHRRRNRRRLNVPALGPLAPMMAELTYDVVDILLDDPDKLPTLDSGEQKEDMD